MNYGPCAVCKGTAYGVYVFPGSKLEWVLCGTDRHRWARTAVRVR